MLDFERSDAGVLGCACLSQRYFRPLLGLLFPWHVLHVVEFRLLVVFVALGLSLGFELVQIVSIEDQVYVTGLVLDWVQI